MLAVTSGENVAYVLAAVLLSPLLLFVFQQRSQRSAAIVASKQAAVDRKAESELRTREKKEDWARQDQVTAAAAAAVRAAAATAAAAAAKAEEVAVAAHAATVALQNSAAAAATTLARNTAAAAATAAANAAVMARSATETQGQLKVIHTLVNSQLSAAMDQRLKSDEAQLVLLRATIDLRRQLTQTEPDTDMTARVAALVDSIGEQSAKLNERKQQTVLANKEITAVAAAVDVPKEKI